MTYIRLSVARPRRGEEEHLEQLMRKLTDLTQQQEGCIETYVLRPKDDSGEIARIAVYHDEASAEHAANSQSVMALRSEIHLASEPGHQERAFFTI